MRVQPSAAPRAVSVPTLAPVERGRAADRRGRSRRFAGTRDSAVRAECDAPLR